MKTRNVCKTGHVSYIVLLQARNPHPHLRAALSVSELRMSSMKVSAWCTEAWQPGSNEVPPTRLNWKWKLQEAVLLRGDPHVALDRAAQSKLHCRTIRPSITPPPSTRTALAIAFRPNLAIAKVSRQLFLFFFVLFFVPRKKEKRRYSRTTYWRNYEISGVFMTQKWEIYMLFMWNLYAWIQQCICYIEMCSKKRIPTEHHKK